MDSEKNPFDSDEEQPENQASLPQLEPEPPTVPIKPTCECDNCDYWVKSADWCPPGAQKFACSEKRVIKERHKQPLLISKDHCSRKRKILSYNPLHLSKIERQTNSKTLVHGEAIPEPVKMFTDTYFSKDVQLSLEHLNYKYSFPIQSFAWPAIFRQMNVLLIGGPHSGKTLSYLPAITTFCTSKEEKYQELAKHKGPLVVIVCPNSRKCEEIFDLFNKMYEKIKFRPRVTIVTYPITHIAPTDILITIPASLIHCLRTKSLNFKRLCHLVLEDISVLLQNHQMDVLQIMQVTDEMLEHRLHSAKVQLIATSEKWSSDLKEFLDNLYILPLVCIGNPLEAAFYGNIHFDIKFLKVASKMEYLEGVLRNEYRLYKTIIICDDSEIVELDAYLVGKGIETMTLSGNMCKEVIEEYEVQWKFMQGGRNKVLLCTDFVFESMLCINDAMWLIHYSFPSSWTAFVKRFSALSAHYPSPFETNEGAVQSKSLVMIDETCDKVMPKILQMLSRLSDKLPEVYQQFTVNLKQRIEDEKIEDNVDLCDTLKLFGKCTKISCPSRHVVTELDASDDIPKSGKVIFNILTLKDVTRCTVQLLEHVNIEGNIKTVNTDDPSQPLVYEPDEEIVCPKKLKIGKFYAHRDNVQEGVVYTLCHVLKLETRSVEVKLISGLVMQTFGNKLFNIPRKLKIVDVFFCNLLPPFNDDSFSGRSFYVTRTSLEDQLYKAMDLTGTIFLQLDNTLWLDNVVEESHVESATITTFNLTKHLIRKGVVQPSKQQINLLHKLCDKCNVSLPNYVKFTAKKSVRIEEVEPQYAFLNDEAVEVILSSGVTPDEFYVRLAKFQPLLQTLEKDMLSFAKSESPNRKLNIEIGKYYLAPDPHNTLYARVKILNADGDDALCFYVDYGDEILMELEKIKVLPTRFLTRLPFQAIQCRLYGLSSALAEWSDDATNILYNYMFEPDTDIYRSLYVKMMGVDDGDMERADKKFSILLKDNYGEKKVLLNQLMLDCGFATTILTKFDDFDIPTPERIDSESEESESPEEPEEQLEDLGDNSDILQFCEDDFVLVDANIFLASMGLTTSFVTPRQPHLPAIKATPSTPQPIEVLDNLQNEKSSDFTPDVFWSQTDQTVKLRIKLIGVEKYKTNIFKNRIFSFSTTVDDRKYGLKFSLYKRIEMVKHKAYGQEVQIILNKTETVEWLQLTSTSKRLRNVHYEILDSQLEEPKRKKILQLDISDDESDGDGDVGGLMYHQESDMGSEFEQELSSTSDDEW